MKQKRRLAFVRLFAAAYWYVGAGQDTDPADAPAEYSRNELISAMDDIYQYQPSITDEATGKLREGPFEI